MADVLESTVRTILAEVAARGATITYEGLLDVLEARDPQLAQQAAVDLAPVLRAVSVAEDEAGRGLLTAVVVRESSGLPGGGFFRLAEDRGRVVADRESAWSAELERVHAVHSVRG